MKKSRLFTAIISLFLVCIFIFNLCGCTEEAKNLTANYTPNQIEDYKELDADAQMLNGFSLKFLQNSHVSDQNTLVSPLSVIYALAMTSNGAKGETLAEIEKAIGINRENLNQLLYTLLRDLQKSKDTKINLANSIWFTDDERFTVNDNFLQTNADYYGADAYKAPFDSSTINQINDWVSKNTNDMIKEIADDSTINPNTVMCLINALCFEAEWYTTYTEDKVESGDFVASNGEVQEVEFMYGEEYSYLYDEKAVGFLTYYKDTRYAFAALLPKKGVTVEEYINWLDEEKLKNTLSVKGDFTVETAIPKFESEFDITANTVLNKMGIKSAFDADLADFSDLGSSSNGNIYLSNVRHKTYIQVAEKGTKAAAVTAEYFEDKLAPMESKKVYLNRPFVYMIIDTQTNVPLFMGVLNNVK